jgi:hypothetical protein
MARQFGKFEINLAKRGTKIQWRNGGQWDEAIVTADGVQGGEYIEARHTGRSTNCVSNGANLRLYPGDIRVA